MEELSSIDTFKHNYILLYSTSKLVNYLLAGYNPSRGFYLTRVFRVTKFLSLSLFALNYPLAFNPKFSAQTIGAVCGTPAKALIQRTHTHDDG